MLQQRLGDIEKLVVPPPTAQRAHLVAPSHPPSQINREAVQSLLGAHACRFDGVLHMAAGSNGAVRILERPNRCDVLYQTDRFAVLTPPWTNWNIDHIDTSDPGIKWYGLSANVVEGVAESEVEGFLASRAGVIVWNQVGSKIENLSIKTSAGWRDPALRPLAEGVAGYDSA